VKQPDECLGDAEQFGVPQSCLPLEGFGTLRPIGELVVEVLNDLPTARLEPRCSRETAATPPPSRLEHPVENPPWATPPTGDAATAFESSGMSITSTPRFDEADLLQLGHSRGVAPHWYSRDMVRTLDLAKWAGRWVALDGDDQVARDAETLAGLMAILDADGIEGLSIMRAPAPGEPVVYGLG